MTIREFTLLVLVLIAGLVMNRCSFERDVTDDLRWREARRNGQDASSKADRAGKELEQRLEELDQRMEGFGERLDRRLDDLGEQLGDRAAQEGQPDGTDISGTAGSIAETRRRLARIHVHPLRQQPEVDLTLDVPVLPATTTVEFSPERAGAVSVITVGKSGGEASVAEAASGDALQLAFEAGAPEVLTLKLPRNVPYVRFGSPPVLMLGLSDSALLLKLNLPELQELSLQRTESGVRLTHAEWSLMVKGITLPVHAAGFDGAKLATLSAGETEEVLLTSRKAEAAGGAE